MSHRALYKENSPIMPSVEWCKIIAMPLDRSLYETRYVWPGPNHTHGNPTKFVWLKHESPQNEDFIEVIY